MNEYVVRSFADAIYVSLAKYNYKANNIDIIKKLIINALEGKSNYFTRTCSAREYVERNQSTGILAEMQNIIKDKSDNIEHVIDKYIEQIFIEKDIRKMIKNNSDLAKVTQKIRYINTSSINDQEFINNVWTTFSNIFIGEDKSISAEEIRFDLIEAALRKAETNKDNTSNLKNISFYSKNLTEMDAVKLIDDYVNNIDACYKNNTNEYTINELFNLINNNSIISGLIIQNLLDYVYFKKEVNDYTGILSEIDEFVKKYNTYKEKVETLTKISKNEPNYILNKADLLVGLLNNTIALNIYRTNKNFVDNDEGKLYSGEMNVEDSIIAKRVEKNNQLANLILSDGLKTSTESLINKIKTLSNVDINFLINIFVLSRSIKENVEKIDNIMYYSNMNQQHVLNILNDKEFYDELLKSINQ